MGGLMSTFLWCVHTCIYIILGIQTRNTIGDNGGGKGEEGGLMCTRDRTGHDGGGQGEEGGLISAFACIFI